MGVGTVIDKLVDKEYKLGSLEGKFDCLSSLKFIYEELGFEAPKEFKGYNLENYAKFWRENEKEARVIFAELLYSLGEEISPGYMHPGDLLLFETATIPVFPAVYTGNGKMLLVTKEGCRIVPFRFFQKMLKQVRRLIK